MLGTDSIAGPQGRTFLDVARLYRFGGRKRPKPKQKYHAVGEEGSPVRDIAESQWSTA